MARKVAVVVGVGKSGSLVLLEGARKGAHDFAEWAQGEGFEVLAFIDDGNTNVSVVDVYQAVRTAIQPGDVERLFLFFAGHGISKGSGNDYWLLSAGPEDPNEAINVDASLETAVTSGVKHIAVFGDACRTMAGKEHANTTGMQVFPSLRIDGVDTEIDRFLATKGGDAAIEKLADDEALEAFGIFTEALIEALSGTVEDAARQTMNGIPRLAVTSQSLKKWLANDVPRRVSELAGRRQRPACVSDSTPPNNVLKVLDAGGEVALTVQVRGRGGPPATVRVFANDGRSRDFTEQYAGPPPAIVTLPRGALYEIEVEQGDRAQPSETKGIRSILWDERVTVRMQSPSRSGGPATPAPPAPAPPPMRLAAAVVAADGTEHATAPAPGVYEIVTRDLVTGDVTTHFASLDEGEAPSPGTMPIDDAATAAVEEVIGARGRDHFESSNGFTIVGATPTDAVVTGGAGDLFPEDGRFHVRGPHGEPRSLAVRLDDGTWLAAALLPGFIGTALVDALPDGSRGVVSLSYVPAPGREGGRPREAYEYALAIAAAAARRGRHDVVTSPGSEIADYLDSGDDVNATLAVIAGYAFSAAGRRREILRVVDGMVARDQVVPYDLAALAHRLDGDVPVAPTFPLMAQGWSYLLDPGRNHPALITAAPSLLPAPWATLPAPSGDALAAAIAAGDL